MDKLWNRWVGSSKSKRTKTQTRRMRRRRLRSESLETRKLLAANLFHNEAFPEDVNEDGEVSALDALTVINAMGEEGTAEPIGSLEPLSAQGNADLQQRRRGRMTDVNNDGRNSALDALMVINRLNRQRHENNRDDAGTDVPGADDPNESPTDADTTTDEIRSIDGTGNNVDNPDLGSANTPLLRVADNDYADGISEPAGADRPSAREISNALSAADPDGTTNERGLSSFVFAWGQFLDHDIDLSLEPETNGESFDIEVPAGDPLFDPFNTGEATIHLTRSEIAEGTGTSVDNPAEQVNAITAFIDGSQVYGSDQATADSLREFVGGRLLITEDGLLPNDDNQGVLAGDIRAAENVVLTSMHALFVREHNRLADEITAKNPSLSDEEIYQEARTIVIAEMQSITYNEFLPALLGDDALSRYTGYDANVDPSIANEFSTAAFRFGHTTLNDSFRFVDDDGNEIADDVSLANAFFQPEMLEETGIDPLLKYAASTLSQEVDLEVVDSLRNFLFGPPGAGGFDLISLNIQRGRDHGLADLNSVREAYGLETYESFDQITSDANLASELESLYGDVNNIDLWVGILAEDHTENGSLGETATTIIADQFERLRDGDRFYYENTMSDREIREIENTTLSDVIARNTNLNSLQDDVFFFSPEISGTVMAQASTTTTSTSDGEGEDLFAPTLIEEDALETLARDSGRQRDQGQDASGRNDRGQKDRPRDDGDRDTPLEPMVGAVLELVDGEGTVVDVAITDEMGRYRFDSVDESGTYVVRMALSDDYVVLGNDALDVQLNNGEENYRGMDFVVLV
ncbi:dockerin type I domain-containing protein [Rhodopirellula sp. JC740]|uniref:Dockerin type I domain-containing protein n=1 Tax=Rhodopirellula halodulae TaxID=2894198 RepID=A0ABS8NL81_9BACT|nr:peroxidase family protein [Rhodopirellula sp. JC740]MCC9643241.1 dockerin type I domain-containing protein [Rhodopirellula sp. JC740]